MITDSFEILIVVFGVIATALFLVSRFRIAARISPVLWILFLSALLGNIGVIPTKNSLYHILSDYAVPFAVCQILLHVHLATIKKTGLPMLTAFAIAGLGSLLGCIVAGMVLCGSLNDLLAGEGWKLAGPYIGTYIGGSLNFLSMWKAMEIHDPNVFAAANAVDNLALIPIFMFWVLTAQWFTRWYPKTQVELSVGSEQAEKSPTRLKLNDLVFLILIALAIMAASGLVKEQILAKWMPKIDIPEILIVTTLALLAGQCKVVRNLQGAKELGDFAFYVFFAAIGAMMDIGKAIDLAPILFLYVGIIVATQVVFVLLVGKVFRIDFRMLAVASIAAKAGPTTVVAYTNTKNWNELAVPGVAAAVLGYVVGNYVAWGGAYVLKAIVG